jgi:threonine synthase
MGLPIDRLIVATNENDVLDEFFRTGTYRVRGSADTYETSSPSMDISKASNFERFVFDLLGARCEADEGSCSATRCACMAVLNWETIPCLPRAAGRYGFCPVARAPRRPAVHHQVHFRTAGCGDRHPHRRWREGGARAAPTGETVVVLETALPIKFAETIREAWARSERPPKFEGIENLPKRVRVMSADTVAVKRYIAEHCPAA